MSKITINDLSKIKEKTLRTVNIREGAYRVKINVHTGTCGIAAGARDILAAVMKEVETRNLKDVIVTNSGCAGLCSQEPMMTIEAANEVAPVKYVYLTPAKVKQIFDTHVMKGQILKEFALAVGSETTV
jgi:NADP-reducing hydrogenase subunit HndB